MCNYSNNHESIPSFFSGFKKKYSHYVCIHIHTTGLGGLQEVLSCAAIDHNGNVLLSELVKPTYLKDWQESESIHNMKPSDIFERGISYSEMLIKLKNVIDDFENILFYNAQFSMAYFPQKYFNNHKVLCCMEVSLPFLSFHPAYTSVPVFLKLIVLSNLLEIYSSPSEVISSVEHATLISKVWSKMLSESHNLEIPEEQFEY